MKNVLGTLSRLFPQHDAPVDPGAAHTLKMNTNTSIHFHINVG